MVNNQVLNLFWRLTLAHSLVPLLLTAQPFWERLKAHGLGVLIQLFLVTVWCHPWQFAHGPCAILLTVLLGCIAHVLTSQHSP